MHRSTLGAYVPTEHSTKVRTSRAISIQLMAESRWKTERLLFLPWPCHKRTHENPLCICWVQRVVARAVFFDVDVETKSLRVFVCLFACFIITLIPRTHDTYNHVIHAACMNLHHGTEIPGEKTTDTN